ncbi:MULTISPECIES: transglycosylase SLT domain-containing protein [unclassified Streptomyces]|uniref:transglycosylase SLT domain-containing protein n=1 Tax=unclassified Streptomyces TaxID=2593676 RepID=UPI00224F141D|nr:MULTISPECIES: transglycosylase SLT domain-containing protein [unclassified Streptomyces]MCX5047184.1 transglycosylase SLT domain-containing protein [Streptomyces sp. NBC_00474]MCX5058115.1 transglycosylase SLT domain-containing protein [Streptomyces sp. NBC_00452]MCX5245005.1 transglycosylase SLT domain-containing protein [Streptomyces sp. NBC_00201]MCX5289263.1 transglycosylase SLT domain-containing protein [Streptomyces sp. NBC_00183]
MPKNTDFRRLSRSLNRHHKIAIAGVATLGAAAIAFSAVPSNAETTTNEATVSTAKVVYGSGQVKDVKASVTDQLAGASLKAQAIEAKAAAKKKTAAEAAAKKKAAAEAAAKKKAAAKKAAAKRKAAAAHRAKEAASRSAKRAALKKAPRYYANNLDGWIKHSLDIMKSKGIPGSYNGLYRNIMRESSGNPKAINDWDINAINGIPSKGLLQVIPPTFNAYHVAGTSWNIYDPVANITAAANYAADKYGSMDNVNSAY